MEIEGTIIDVPVAETGVGRNGPWRRQTVVVRYEDGQYPKSIALQNMPKAEAFGRLRIGQRGKFKFDCKTRSFNGKYFNDINCWAWDIYNEDNNQPPV